MDASGYGPWLNPKTVEFVASATGGEPILVQCPEGDKMKTKILGLIARSLLRAASRMTVMIHGASVLAVEGTSGCSRNMLEEGRPWALEAMPGSHLLLALAHPEVRHSTELSLNL